MSSQRQGVLPRLPLPAGVFRHGINLWPPFLGAGIRVTRVAADYREVDVKLWLGRLNRNFFGTQFGGSMFVDKTLYIRRHRTAAKDEPAAPSARARPQA